MKLILVITLMLASCATQQPPPAPPPAPPPPPAPELDYCMCAIHCEGMDHIIMDGKMPEEACKSPPSNCATKALYCEKTA